jgi:hypothetical protein
MQRQWDMIDDAISLIGEVPFSYPYQRRVSGIIERLHDRLQIKAAKNRPALVKEAAAMFRTLTGGE